MTSELSLLHAGVRFIRSSNESKTSDGYKVTLPAIKVQGPKDPELVQSLREAVAKRVAVVVDLKAARAKVLADRAANGQSVALPVGVCDTCGDPLPTVFERSDGKRMVRTDCQGGMCVLCAMARMQVVFGREA